MSNLELFVYTIDNVFSEAINATLQFEKDENIQTLCRQLLEGKVELYGCHNKLDLLDEKNVRNFENQMSNVYSPVHPFYNSINRWIHKKSKAFLTNFLQMQTGNNILLENNNSDDDDDDDDEEEEGEEEKEDIINFFESIKLSVSLNSYQALCFCLYHHQDEFVKNMNIVFIENSLDKCIINKFEVIASQENKYQMKFKYQCLSFPSSVDIIEIL